jgi:hypothetical protein
LAGLQLAAGAAEEVAAVAFNVVDVRHCRRIPEVSSASEGANLGADTRSIPIEASGQFALGDVWSGTRVISRDYLVSFSGLGAILVLYGATGFIFDERGWANHVAVMAVGVVIPAYVWLTRFNRCRETFKGTPNLKGNVRYEFDDAGLRVVALHSSGETQWDTIVKWKEGKKVFVLYRTPKLGEIIPKRFFNSGVDVERLRELLVAHVEK